MKHNRITSSHFGINTRLGSSIALDAPKQHLYNYFDGNQIISSSRFCLLQSTNQMSDKDTNMVNRTCSRLQADAIH